MSTTEHCTVGERDVPKIEDTSDFMGIFSKWETEFKLVFPVFRRLSGRLSISNDRPKNVLGNDPVVRSMDKWVFPAINLVASRGVNEKWLTSEQSCIVSCRNFYRWGSVVECTDWKVELTVLDWLQSQLKYWRKHYYYPIFERVSIPYIDESRKNSSLYCVIEFTDCRNNLSRKSPS